MRAPITESIVSPGQERTRQGVGEHPNEQQQVFITVMRKIREGKLTTIDEVKREMPDLSDKGSDTITPLLHSQDAGRDELAFWVVYDKLSQRHSLLKAWRDLVAALSEPPSSDGSAVMAKDPVEVHEQAAEWLWQGRIPLGDITLIDGEDSTVRSALMCDLAGRVSSGTTMPDGTPGVAEGAGVVLIAPYHPSSQVIEERLQRAGADCSRIADLSNVLKPHPRSGELWEMYFSLASDLPVLEEAIKRVQAKLVIINPVYVTFSQYDVENDQHVHQMLTPLRELAKRLQVACVLMRDPIYDVMHPSRPRQRYGAISFTTLASSGMKIEQYPKNFTHIRLAPYKNAYGSLAPRLSFAIEDHGSSMTVKQTAVRHDVPCGCSSMLYRDRPAKTVPWLRWQAMSQTRKEQ